MRLYDCTDQALRAEFEEHQDDLTRLQAISDVLKSRDSDEALELHWAVAGAIRKLRKSAPASRPADEVARWLSTYLYRRTLKSPDGRPLHRYRMSDGEYQEARRMLRSAHARLLREDRVIAGLFVVFSAEWFRRESTSLSLRWDALPLDGLEGVPQDICRRLAQDGLAYWKRPLVKIGGGREFLLSVALEGGISAHVIADGASSWLSDYLRHVMRFALVDGMAGHVNGYAHDMSWMIRKSYRQEGFVDLCAELVLTLVDWRRIVDAGPAGVDPVAYLDAHSPDWKASLPIFMPTGDERIARRLLGGLLVEKAGGTSSGGIGVERYLTFDGDLWQPAVLLRAQGEIPAAKLLGLSEKGRWRASPSGRLADFLPSQIALFEPPTEFQKTWRVRPTAPLGKLLTGYEFHRGVAVNLTCASDVVPMDWPGGSPIAGPIMTFVPDDPNDQLEPRRLRFVKTGSTSLPAPTVYVLVPETWNAVTAEGLPPARMWRASGNSSLYAVSGTAYFHNPGASIGERYRIEAGKDERLESLFISPPIVSKLQSSDNVEIFEGMVTLEIVSPSGARQPRSNELYVRRPGGPWRPMAERKLAAMGLFDISWRDPTADIQLERRRIAIVPVGARVTGQMISASEARVQRQNFRGWTLSLTGRDVTVQSVSEDEVHFTFTGRPRYCVEAVLRAPEAAPFNILVPVKSRYASIVSSKGEIVMPGQEIDVAGLRGAMAESPAKTTLTLTPKNGRSSSLQFKVSGELPLSALKPVVEGLMARLADQDAVLELDFLGDARAPVRLKRYRYCRPKFADNLILFDRKPANSPVVRMIMAPEKEYVLEEVAEATFSMPDFCEGPCLVYLRDGPDVVSRPLLVPRSATANGSVLRSAMLVEDMKLRSEAIGTVLDAFEASALPADDVDYLVTLATSLNGVPATAFDVLKEIALRPGALLRLLLSAKDDAEKQAIWGLQEQLPFLWLALPAKLWREALLSERVSMEAALLPVPLPPEKRSQLLESHMAAIRERLISLDPALEFVCNIGETGQEKPPSLDLVLGEFVRDQYMFEDDAPQTTPKRNPALELLAAAAVRLPEEFKRYSVGDFEGLLVPAVLAAMATGRIISTDISDIVVRRTLREHGRYVSFAYPHLLRFYEDLT